jgi:hypothetical protein
LTGDSKAVDLMITRLEYLLGPAGMSAFLVGQVTPYLKGRAANRFANEGDAVSGRWSALSPVTISIRTSMGYGGEHPINRRTGALERWVTGSTPSLVTSPAVSVLTYPGNPPTGKLRDKVVTAQTGQMGKSSGTVPRQVLGMDSTDYIAILGMLALSIEAVGRTGRI